MINFVKYKWVIAVWLVPVSSCAMANIYGCVDINGVTHYSNLPNIPEINPCYKLVHKIPLRPAQATEVQQTATVKKSPKGNTLRGVTLQNYKLSPGAGNVMLVGQFTIANANKIQAKDFVLACEIFGESGTKIGGVSKAVYVAIAGGKTRTVSDIHMGFAPPQIARYGCELKGFS